MTEPFVEEVELEREDGLRVRARRLLPDLEVAERCHGAGLVVAADLASATDDAFARAVVPLAEAGYHVVAVTLSGDLADTVLDVAAAIRSLRELARGKVGVLGLGEAATVALAAATELPAIDAVVHAGGALPPGAVRLGRLRAAVMVHQAGRGARLGDDDVRALVERIAPSKAPLLVRRHDDEADGFYLDDSTEARVARDQTRQFFDLQLT